MTTPPNTGYEILYERLSRAIKNVLQAHVGRENHINRQDLLAKLQSTGYRELHERQMRQVIHDMRIEGHPVCSESGLGYWWPASRDEVFAVVEKEFRSKSKDMLRTARIMRQAAVNEFGQQERMF